MSDSSDADRPITSIEMTSLPAMDSLGQDPDTAIVHRHVVTQLANAQHSLLSIKSLSSLVKYLLEDLPVAFRAPRAELLLQDPEGHLAALLPIRKLFGEALGLHTDTQITRDLYDEDLVTEIIDLDDPRMFELLPGTTQALGAVMMPLVDGNRLVGSYHLALTEEMTGYADLERDLFAMLAQLIASALLRVVEYQQVDLLTLIDPVTEVGNLRAFRRNVRREVYWARRVEKPLSLMVMSVDDLDDLARGYGEVACQFAQRRVSQRIYSQLRATDYIAHVSPGHFTLLLPDCNEPHAHEAAERVRSDIENFSIDDGQGASLYVTLSLGLVVWDPQLLPIESTDQLVNQMETKAEAALHRAVREGGNTVSVGRLGALIL